jgi:hypothetical protein
MKEQKIYTSNVESAWQRTLDLVVEKPVYEQDVRTRLQGASDVRPITLFVPWGVRPFGEPGDSEWVGLETIASYQRVLTSCGIANEVLLMPADVYAIEINGYDWGMATTYFNWVWKRAEGMGFTVIPWSIIRDQNEERYNNVLRWEANIDALWRSIPKSLWYKDLLSTAYRRSTGTTDQEIKESAFRYLRERIAEARVIESVYKPIKLSMVSPTKDNIVDCQLPRLYLLPQESRFPWLK